MQRQRISLGILASGLFLIGLALDATYVYFGNLVYGPGKVFAEQFVSGLQHGMAHIVGRGENRLPLTQVTDAPRALVHLPGQVQANAGV